MSIAEKLVTVAENQQKVFEAGAKWAEQEKPWLNEWFNDGDTHIWIELCEGRTSPLLRLAVTGTATIDWGDGTAPDVCTGTSSYVMKDVAKHEYAKPGNYIITIKHPVDYIRFLNTNGKAGFFVNSDDSEDVLNDAYRCAVKKIEFAPSTKDSGQFYEMYGLTSIVSTGNPVALNIYNLSGCCNLRVADFSSYTAVPALSRDIFVGTPPDLKIRVPAALYDEWIAATNWVAHASKIVAV